MDMNKKIIIKISWLMLTYWVFVLCAVSVVYGQTNQQVSPADRLAEVSNQIELNMANSNNLIEKGDYFQAEESTNKVLNGINFLLDVFVPLDERIKKLLEMEQTILTKTLKAENQSANQKTSIRQKDQQDLVFDQIKNREETEKAVTVIQQQQEHLKKQIEGANSSNQTADPNDQLKTLTEMTSLLGAAQDLQSNAIDFLEDSRFKAAIPKEKEAIEKLKEALKKLQKEGQQSQQSQDQQQKNNQQSSQDQNNNQKKNQQDQSEQSAENQQKPKSPSDKMTPEEALKELSKLRKKINDEKERRRKQYGDPAIGGPVPVEKDW